MIKDETLDYLQTLHGWCSEEKMQKLYDLVKKVSEENPDTTPLTVELGIFGGRSLLPMAAAHKDMGKGFAIGIDSFDNITPTEGSNAQANNDWWATLDIQTVFNSFVKATKRPEWDGYVKYLKGRSDSFAGEFKDESILLLHEDSNHNVETITKELELWAPKVKTGGYWVADDTDWLESKEGYAKLPSFGFELVEDFTTWQIWRKKGVVMEFNEADKILHNVKGTIRIESFDLSEQEANGPMPEGRKEIHATETDFYTIKEVAEVKGEQPKGFAAFVVSNNKKTEDKISESATPNTKPVKEGAIRLGNLDVKPIMIYIPDTPEWKARGEKGVAHFKERGIKNIFVLNGIHGEKWGIAGRHIYLADNRPEEQYYIGHGKVAGNLTQYLSFVVMDALDYTHFLSLEDDCRFKEGWREELDKDLLDVPADFDILFIGSCCCKALQPVHVKGNIYHFPYRGKDKWNWFPQCSHALLIAKKAIPHLIATNRDVANPSDVSLVMNSFPKMKVYAILPRLAEQENTHLPE